MSKTTFIEIVDKAGTFFDNVFHHHKATYKGMGQFFQNYADIERNYSNSLLWHSQTSNLFKNKAVSVIPDIKKEQPSVQQGVKEICGNLEKVSQLHFNFSERLREMSNYYKDEYTSSKKNKEVFMKEKIDMNLADHDNIKSCRDRDTINNKEKSICKDLYQALD